MKFHRSYLAFGVVLAPLAGMALVTACGSSDDSVVQDSGPDVTVEAAKDVAPEATKSDASDASCANDVDLTQYLPNADASIDVDAGNLNLTACTGCFKANCGTDINACNQDCACRQSVIDAVTCLAQGTDFQTCGTEAILSGDNNLQALFGCALQKCGSICLPDGGASDSGSSDATDGG